VSVSEYVVLQGGFVSTLPNSQAGGPPLVGCPRLLIQFIRSYPPCRRPFLFPQPEGAPCRGDRDPLHPVYNNNNKLAYLIMHKVYWYNFQNTVKMRKYDFLLQRSNTGETSVACLAFPYFSTFAHKRHDFRRKKFIGHKMYVLAFSTTFG